MKKTFIPNRKKFIFNIVLLLLALLWGMSNAMSKDMKDTKNRVFEIGDEYVSTHYPDFKKKNKKPVIKDKTGYWEFTYELPEYMIGGAPVVHIDKNSLRVIKSYRTQ